MTPRVAVATCAGVDVDPDSPVLLSALAEVGVDATLAVWTDPHVEWSSFDLTVIRSTWDYTDAYDEFLTWATSIERLENPLAVIRFSSDKHYLADLARAGVAIVPTTFVAPDETPTWPTGDFVVKPAIGAGSRGAERFTSQDLDAAFAHLAGLQSAGRHALIQPYIDSVDTQGEFAVIFIDGAFAHVMNKAAMLGQREMDRNRLYLLEAMTPDEPREGLVDAATAALRAAGAEDLLYARVDLVWSGDEWVVMELELVEPSLFLTHRPAMATRLADAIRVRAEARQRR